MAVLNEKLTFASLSAGDRRAFVGSSGNRLLLPAGKRLYKFSGYGHFNPRGGVSPWWASVEPMPGTTDIGLDGHVAAARNAGIPMTEYARENFAVMLAWNSLSVPHLAMAKCLHISLAEPVYAFGGLIQRQYEAGPTHGVQSRLKPEQAATQPIMHGGGAYQLYIPNLTGGAVNAGPVQLMQ